VLGLASYRAGQFEDSIRHLRQSLATDPGWAGASLNWPVLALAHSRLGQHEEARRWLGRSRGWLDQAARDLAREPVGLPATSCCTARPRD
jgi:hypothetical protein